MLGREIKKTALGKSWTFGRLDKNTLDEFGDWVKEEVGNPFELADKLLADAERVPPGSLQDAIIAEWKAATKEAKSLAEQIKGFSLESELGKRFIKSLKGMGFLALCMLRGNHPDIDEATAFSVLLELGPDEFQKIMQKAAGADRMPPLAKNGDTPAGRIPPATDPLDKSELSIGGGSIAD